MAQTVLSSLCSAIDFTRLSATPMPLKVRYAAIVSILMIVGLSQKYSMDQNGKAVGETHRNNTKQQGPCNHRSCKAPISPSLQFN
eukprot:3314697-Amphidinium_carterae.1